MGCFNSTKHKGFTLSTDHLCQYPRTAKVGVKIRNVAGVTINTQSVHFTVTEPISLVSKEVDLHSEKLLISSCVLPGLDPRGEYKKKCQDNCFFLSDANGVLCCLFDGHGTEGEKVADFCQRIIEKLFATKKAMLAVIIT